MVFGQVLQMIVTEIVDLYQSFGLDRGSAQGGLLRGWVWETPDFVSARRRRPTVLILPGGGYIHISPREGEQVAMRFYARGYNAFVLTYSVFPSRFPVALREAAMAMRYIREQASRWEIHPDMVAAIGFSAAGHLCGCLGTLFDSPEVADIAPPEVLRPNALGLCYPVAVSWGKTHEGSFENLTGGDPDLRRRLSLDALVRRDMPPVCLWHTRTDDCVPPRNSLLLAQALDEAGVDFTLHVYREGPHGLSLGNQQSYEVVPKLSKDILDWPEMMMDFFEDLGFSITDGKEDA